MSLGQQDLWGRNKVELSIQRLKEFEPPEGYYLAFSGGKDSVCIKALADMAGVKYDAHYNITTVDPPELVYFMRDFHPDVIREKPEKTMWKLIEENGPPTRLHRFCCKHLKERGGQNRFTVTGVRWAESNNRRSNQGIITLPTKNAYTAELAEENNLLKTSRGGVVLNNDNNEARRIVEVCYQQTKTVLNPIIDWSDDDVWEFINKYNIPYCELYDEGFRRLGCIGCPMGTKKEKEKAFDRWPGYKKRYLKSFEAMLARRKEKGLKEISFWQTPEDVMNWWIYGKEKVKT